MSLDKTPLVSVVIPTYNHAHFLSRAVQSVLDQTYQNWELIVVDNYSQDNTDEVIQGFPDSRITLLKIHNNGVIAASRNLGIREAKGVWVAFLDSDDCWYPEKLETLIAAVGIDQKFDVLSNDELLVDIKSGFKRVLRYGPYQDEFYKALIVEGNRLSTSATVVRRDFLVQHEIIFNEAHEFVTVEDYGFWLDLAHFGARFYFIHSVQGEFVVHGSNSSAQLSRHLQNGEALLKHHVFNVQQFQRSPERLWKLVSIRLELGHFKPLLEKGSLGLAVRLLWRILISSPVEVCRLLFLKIKYKFLNLSF